MLGGKSIRLSLLMTVAFVVVPAVLLVPADSGRAIQAPRISLDMVTDGNSYNESANTMAVGAIDSCLESATANTISHVHTIHIIIHDVEDLIGWQVRLNYVGDRMRPSSFDPTPFTDSIAGGTVGFVNLPIDPVSLTHRVVSQASSIPSAPADGTNTSQTALLSASYIGDQGFAISPDTPPKSPTPDDISYSAPGGGVVASLTLEVVGDESGQLLQMDLDDGSPNSPGSGIIIFTATGAVNLDLDETALGDGLHAEGSACLPPVTPTSTPTLTPPTTPTPPLPTPTGTPGLTPVAMPTPTQPRAPGAMPRVGGPPVVSGEGAAVPAYVLLLAAACSISALGAAFRIWAGKVS